jgi:hypothetical protein
MRSQITAFQHAPGSSPLAGSALWRRTLLVYVAAVVAKGARPFLLLAAYLATTLMMTASEAEKTEAVGPAA